MIMIMIMIVIVITGGCQGTELFQNVSLLAGCILISLCDAKSQLINRVMNYILTRLVFPGMRNLTTVSVTELIITVGGLDWIVFIPFST